MLELRDIMGKQASREDSELESFAAEAITDLIRFQKCLSREKMRDKDFLICLDICLLRQLAPTWNFQARESLS